MKKSLIQFFPAYFVIVNQASRGLDATGPLNGYRRGCRPSISPDASARQNDGRNSMADDFHNCAVRPAPGWSASWVNCFLARPSAAG
jgi:hypothetical protein